MIQALLGPIVSLIGTAVDKAVPDRDEAARLKQELSLQVMQSSQQELQAVTNIILAEAQGESWLQRNWRPMLMLWFAGLVGAHWLGFTPENLSEQTISDLLAIVQVGVGGYVIGRSAEKVMREYKRKE